MPIKFQSVVWFAGILAAGIACRRSEQTVSPSYRPLTEAVYASGQVLPRNEYTVFASANGYLGEKAVEEGDIVSKGSRLFTIEGPEQQIRARNAYDQYQIAQSNLEPVLRELEASLASARARLHNDSVNQVRYRNLFENRATTRLEYDRSQLAYQTSHNEYLALKSRYQQTRNRLEADLQNARSQYRINAQQQADYTVCSRIDGKVYSIYKEAGELVRAGEALARLGDEKQLYLRLNVDELDIDKIAPGQTILVTLDSYEDTVFHARVSKIYPMLDPQSQTFRVDAEFTQAPAGMSFAGLTAEANIIVRQKDRALTIPRTYVIGNDSVRVRQDGNLQTIRIKKGVENLEFVEVLAGLDSSSVVVLQ